MKKIFSSLEKKNISSNEKHDQLILNGPLNYIELVNEKTGQNIFLFMDYHKHITKQIKCEEYEAKDVDKFLYKLLSETSDTLDFFLEINPTDITNSLKNYSDLNNDNYILEVRKIFRKIYNEKNKIVHEQNIRLHYIDIRDYSLFNLIVKSMFDLLDNINIHKLADLSWIIDKLITLREILNKILKMSDKFLSESFNEDISVDIINKKIKKKSSDSNLNETNAQIPEVIIDEIGFEQLLSKILNSYQDKTNQDNIREYFISQYYDVSKELINYIDTIVKNLSDVETLFDYQIKTEQLNIDDYAINDSGININGKVAYYGLNEKIYDQISSALYNQINGLTIVTVKLGSVFMDCFFLMNKMAGYTETKTIEQLMVEQHGLSFPFLVQLIL